MSRSGAGFLPHLAPGGGCNPTQQPRTQDGSPRQIPGRGKEGCLVLEVSLETAQAHCLSLQGGTQGPELPHPCSPTGNGAPALGEVLGAIPQVPLGRQRRPAPVGSWAEGPVPAIRIVEIVVTSPDAAQTAWGWALMHHLGSTGFTSVLVLHQLSGGGACGHLAKALALGLLRVAMKSHEF